MSKFCEKQGRKIDWKSGGVWNPSDRLRHHQPSLCFGCLRFNRDVDVMVESIGEPQQALHGIATKAAAQESRHFRLA